MSRYRDRLISNFKTKEFLAGSTIFKEDAPCNCSYMIREGEVRIIKEKSTLETIANENGQCRFVDTTLQTRRGYLSDTFAKFQLGEAIPGQWIGDDFLIGNNENYMYTTIAQSKVVCLELARDEYENIPKELLKQFKKHILERRLWIVERMQNVTKFVEKLMRRTTTQDYSESLAEKRKLLPMASINAIDAIRKREILASYPPPIIIKPPTEIAPTINTLSDTAISSSKETLKLRSLFRLNDPKLDLCLEKSQSQFGIYNYLAKCTPLSYASSTKPLNFMFPIISRERQSRLCSKSLKVSPAHVSEKTPVTVNFKQFQKKELNAFHIGKKIINLLSNRKEKPPTPNPFSRRLSSKALKTSYNAPFVYNKVR